jgi:hypothetical protein
MFISAPFAFLGRSDTQRSFSSIQALRDVRRAELAILMKQHRSRRNPGAAHSVDDRSRTITQCGYAEQTIKT